MAKDKGGKKSAASGALLQQQATSQLITLLTRLPEQDDVLKKAGVQRHKLFTLLSDDEIYQATETRYDAMAEVDFKLEPSEGDAADFLFTELNTHIDALLTLAFDARLYGYAVGELVGIYDEQGRFCADFFGKKPMQWFEPKPDGSLRFFPDTGVGGALGIAVDTADKFCLLRSKPSYENPKGDALLSRLYWPFFFRTNGWKFWAKFLERFGSPLLVGKSNDTQTMLTALLNAHGSAAASIGKDDEIASIGTAGSNSGAFEAFETACLRRINKVVLGQTLTSGTDGGTGSRSLGEVHDGVRLTKRNSDLKLLTKACQWFVDVLCKYNGFDVHKITFPTEKNIDAARAKRDNDLHTLGVRFKRSYFEDQYNLNADHFDIEDSCAVMPIKASLPNNRTLTFADDGTQFTPEQQEVETLADDTLQRNNTPIPRTAILAAIEAAEDEADLGKRMLALIEQYAQSGQFADDMAGTLFMAEVMGYVHAEVGK